MDVAALNLIDVPFGGLFDDPSLLLRRASGAVVAPAQMLASSGTYTGTGAPRDIDLPFVPDVVFVWAVTQPLAWRSNLSWHGRTQFFHSLASAYRLRSSTEDLPWLLFSRTKFGVDTTYSVSARTYSYLAIRSNNADTLQELSIVGNALSNRQVNFTSRLSKLIFGKRDSPRASVWATETGANARGDAADGPLVAGIGINAAGMLLSNSIFVNENSNVALGEAIEYMSFVEKDGFRVVRHVGTGGTTTITGLGSVVFVIDASSAAGTGPKPQAVRVGGTSVCFDGTAPVEAITLSGGVLSLPMTYNTLSSEYVVVSFNENSATENAVSAMPQAATVGQSAGAIQLSTGITLSGAQSWEYYGRNLGYAGQGNFLPLLMMGNGVDGGTTGFNGGCYLFETDPDANGWQGGVLRIIHSQYLARLRAAPHDSINYYNLNTGITLPAQGPLHIVATHNGTGLWRVFINGKLVKEYNLDLNQPTYGNRVNGGSGTSLPVYANGTATSGVKNEMYRAQIWNTALSDAEAKSLFNNARTGAAWAGTAPLNAWDFRNAIPAGVTGITLAAPGTGLLPIYWQEGGENATKGVPVSVGADTQVVASSAVTTNSRVLTRIGTGSFTVRSVLEYGNATRILCRTTTERTGSSIGGVQLFDLTGTGTIDRTDNVSSVDAYLAYIGFTAAGQNFVIKPTTTITRTA